MLGEELAFELVGGERFADQPVLRGAFNRCVVGRSLVSHEG
jgi:hypothetical protein